MAVGNDVHNKNTNNAGAQNTNNLAAAVFATKPDDKLATVDVYKAGGISGSLNSIQDWSKKYKSGFENLFRGGDFAKGLLGDIKSLRSGNISDSLNRAMGVAGKYSGHFNKGGVGDLLNRAKSFYKEISPMVSQGKHLIKDIKNNDWSNLNQSLALLSSVTNSDLIKAVDPNGNLAWITGAINEATRLGYSVYNEFNAIKNYVKNELDGLGLSNLFADSYDIAIEHSDMDLAAKMIEEIGSGTIKRIKPNSIEEIARKYKIMYTNGSLEIDRRFETIDRLFNMINPNWYKREDGETFDFSRISQRSQDFETVFYGGIQSNLDKEPQLHKEYGKWALVARTFRGNPEDLLSIDVRTNVYRR